MNNKLFYVTPESELILVRFEENILSGGEEEKDPTVEPIGTEQNL
jgi:hypothetical protein